MTASPSIDPEVFLHEQLAQASPDLMRQLLGTFINNLLKRAEAALTTVVATCYLLGVSTRRMDKLHRAGHQRAVQVPGLADGHRPG